MVCFHPILTWTKRDNLASKKYYPLSLNCLARCRAEFWSLFPKRSPLPCTPIPKDHGASSRSGRVNVGANRSRPDERKAGSGAHLLRAFLSRAQYDQDLKEAFW